MTVVEGPWVTDRALPQPSGYLEDCYRGLLIAAEGQQAVREHEPDETGRYPLRDGVEDTPARAARAWRELTAGYAMDPAQLLATEFEAPQYDELVLVGHVPFYSMCEHHLLTFHGVGHVGYIANGKVTGLSKLARLLDGFARRLQLQERITYQVADAIEEHLQPTGVIVVLEARHLCMEQRGAKAAGAVTVTSALRGALKEKPEARAEALALIERSRPK